MKIWGLALAALLLVELSCAPSQKIVRPRTLSLREVLRRVQDRDDKISTLTGSGTITIENPEESNSGSFRVKLKKPDSLRVEFGGPFGIHVGTLFLSRDTLVYYNWRNNHAVVGTPDAASLHSILNVKLRFDEILDAFAGGFPMKTQTDSAVTFTVEDEMYVLRYRSREGTREFRIDGDSFVISSYRLLGDDGMSNLNVFASRIDTSDSVAMPRLLRVIFPKERRSVTIAYDDVEFNRPVECSFQLPKQAEEIQR